MFIELGKYFHVCAKSRKESGFLKDLHIGGLEEKAFERAHKIFVITRIKLFSNYGNSAFLEKLQILVICFFNCFGNRSDDSIQFIRRLLQMLTNNPGIIFRATLG